MKHPFYKGLVAAGALAMAGSFVACGDDSGSNNGSVADLCAGIVATEQVSVLNANGVKFLVYPISIEGFGKVTLADGTLYGSYDGANIYDANGTPVMAIGYADLVDKCEASVAPIPEDPQIASSESTPIVGPGGTQEGISSDSNPIVGPGGIQEGVSSDSNPVVGPGGETPESSDSEVIKPSLENGFPPIESYGEPPAEYTKDLLSNGKTGWSSRYWDACKPHCSWLSSVDTTSDEAYKSGMTVARNCNIHDVEVPAYTLGHAVQQYWMGYEGTPSACVNDNAGGTFTCTDMAPIAVNENLSYGYVAGSGALYQFGCGKCYHLQFNGGKNDGDVKVTHKALKGKHMVVMVSNIGYDVEEGQFDLMVPGGGVGIFNALSTQIGVPPSGLGANAGGIGYDCFVQEGWDSPMEKFQACINKKCEEIFAGWPNLLRGCKWYADWYMAADNPTFNWEEVECPQYLVDHYMTTINTEKDNRYRWRDDWSDYKAGEELKTQECLTAEYPKGCAP